LLILFSLLFIFYKELFHKKQKTNIKILSFANISLLEFSYEESKKKAKQTKRKRIMHQENDACRN
jgi:hypothetical protein